MVTGWRQPNLDPIAFRPKKALLPALQRSEVRWAVDGDTERRIPRWSFSGKGSPHTCHDLVWRFWVRDLLDSPMTSIEDLEAFSLYRQVVA